MSSSKDVLIQGIVDRLEMGQSPADAMALVVAKMMVGTILKRCPGISDAHLEMAFVLGFEFTKEAAKNEADADRIADLAATCVGRTLDKLYRS